jgi:hypothetical protein
MSSPSTPEHAPPAIRSHIRRVHTLPPKLLDPTRTPPQVAHPPDAIEILFHAASAKVVAFEAPTSSSRPSSRSGVKAGEQDNQFLTNGSLPWISSTERTLAAGTFMLRILSIFTRHNDEFMHKAYTCILGTNALTCQHIHPLPNPNSIKPTSYSLSESIYVLTKLNAGPLRIYRVPNTGVSFLNSGRFLRAILSKSQCWCVDDEATFVLRGRDESFYRIELPRSDDEEKEVIEQFKRILSQLLRYEKTPCPFKKGYSDLVEQPSTPVRPKSAPRHSPAKKWRLNKIWEPEDPEYRAEFQARRNSLHTDSIENTTRPVLPFERFSSKFSPSRHGRFGTTRSSPGPSSNGEVPVEEECIVGPEDPESDTPSTDSNIVQRQDSVLEINVSAENLGLLKSRIGPEGWDEDAFEPQTYVKHVPGMEVKDEESFLIHPLKQHPITNRLQPVRSVTAPPHLTVTASPPSSHGSLSANHEDAETLSITSSRDSFYSVDEQTDKVPENHNFPMAHEDTTHLTTLFVPSHSRNSSGTASSVPETPRAINHTHTLPSPIILSDVSNSDDGDFEPLPSTPSTALRLRRPLKTAELQSPGIISDISAIAPQVPANLKPLGSELIRKTCSILMAPPSHLISLMLHIAELLLNRMLSGVTRHIPGSWESSDADDESNDDFWNDFSDGEDDFGFPLVKHEASHRAKTEVETSKEPQERPSNKPTADGWEID